MSCTISFASGLNEALFCGPSLHNQRHWQHLASTASVSGRLSHAAAHHLHSNLHVIGMDDLHCKLWQWWWLSPSLWSVQSLFIIQMPHLDGSFCGRLHGAFTAEARQEGVVSQVFFTDVYQVMLCCLWSVMWKTVSELAGMIVLKNAREWKELSCSVVERLLDKWDAKFTWSQKSISCDTQHHKQMQPLRVQHEGLNSLTSFICQFGTSESVSSGILQRSDLRLFSYEFSIIVWFVIPTFLSQAKLSNVSFKGWFPHISGWQL